MELSSEFNLKDLIESLDNIHQPVSSYRATHLVKAQQFDENNSNEEMHKIYHLIEAHCPTFRNKACNLFGKAKLNVSHNVFPMDSEHLAFHCCTNNRINDILNMMEQMPTEWTLVQLTSLNVHDSAHETTAPLQISVFECGQSKMKPFTIQVSAPEDSWGYPINILHDLNDTLEEINAGYVKLKGLKKGGLKETYSEYKCRLNTTMKQYVKVVQNKWLGEWRCLLSGRFSDCRIEQQIDEFVVGLLQEYKKCDIPMKSRQILKYMLRAQVYIDAKETKKILQRCFPEITKDEVIAVLHKINDFTASIAITSGAARNPILLIVDASIDQVPWEMLDVFANQGVSRMQSFYVTFTLFEAHEAEIINGRKVIKAEGIQGGAMLNPSANLPRMEKRLSAFHSYWTKDWRMMIGKRPTEEEFLDFVMNCDIFDYSGHGDGMQYIKYPSLEKLRINAVVFLFGCRSVGFKHSPLFEPWGTSQYYTMCCCPCVVGNLYNVTDLDCDVMCTSMLSLWVPEPIGKTHWLDIDLKQWASGNHTMDIETLPKLPISSKKKQYSEMLVALNKAKWSSNISYVTQAACIARGIPVMVI